MGPCVTASQVLATYWHQGFLRKIHPVDIRLRKRKGWYTLICLGWIWPKEYYFLFCCCDYINYDMILVQYRRVINLVGELWDRMASGAHNAGVRGYVCQMYTNEANTCREGDIRICFALSPSQYNNWFSMYGHFHYKAKTATRPHYLLNENTCNVKTTSLYWDGSLDACNNTRPIRHPFVSLCAEMAHVLT